MNSKDPVQMAYKCRSLWNCGVSTRIWKKHWHHTIGAWCVNDEIAVIHLHSYDYFNTSGILYN